MAPAAGVQASLEVSSWKRMSTAKLAQEVAKPIKKKQIQISKSWL